MMPPFARTGAAARIGQGGRRTHASIPERPAAPLRGFRRSTPPSAAASPASSPPPCWNSLYIFVGSNVHVVAPGDVYRAAQLGRAGAETGRARVRDSHRRQPDAAAATRCRPTWTRAGPPAELNICQEDIGFSACRLPPVPALRELVEVLDRCDYPILFHCHRGIDRTGMASAVALLAAHRRESGEAREQLGLRYGHWPFGKTANIDRFFDLYQEWLSGRPHSPETLPPLGRDRILSRRMPRPSSSCSIRRPGRCIAPPDRPFGFRVRCANTSIKPWVLQPGNNAGVHLGWFVINDDQNYEAGEGRSGLFDAVVPPGEGVDLTVAPAGRCRRGATTWSSTWWTSSTPGFTSWGPRSR